MLEKLHDPKQNDSLSLELNKPQILVGPLNGNEKLAKKPAKRQLPEDPDMQVDKKRFRVSGATKIDSSAVKQPCLPNKCLNKEPLSSAHTGRSKKDLCSPGTFSERLSEVNYDENRAGVDCSIEGRMLAVQKSQKLGKKPSAQVDRPRRTYKKRSKVDKVAGCDKGTSGTSCGKSNGMTHAENKAAPDNNTESRRSAVRNSSDLENQSLQHKLDVQTEYFHRFCSLLREIHSTFNRYSSMFNHVDMKFIGSCENYERDTDPISNCDESRNNIPTASTPAATEQVIVNEDNDSEEDNEAPLKKRGRARKFVLPSDYDPKHSRWTLKHREYKQGLVELLPHTEVYINAVSLGNCKRLSKDCKTLARMLLMEIFTESALSTCSLTGARARAFDSDGSDVRPGLDEHARTVLLTFVEEYGRENGWIRHETQAILNSIRNKMQEMRIKYGN